MPSLAKHPIPDSVGTQSLVISSITQKMFRKAIQKTAGVDQVSKRGQQTSNNNAQEGTLASVISIEAEQLGGGRGANSLGHSQKKKDNPSEQHCNSSESQTIHFENIDCSPNEK